MWDLARSGGTARMVLVGVCTAVVSGLLLVAIALLMLPADPQEALFNLVADPGVRGGTAFGTVLVTLPALLLLHQAVRLGTAARERRLAALRLAGATPAQVRALGAVEVGVPSLLGGVAGIGVYWLLRAFLGGQPYGQPLPDDVLVLSSRLRLVPTTVTPAWWMVLLVVVGVTVAGLAVGALASRGLVVTPLGVSRQQRTAPPRPWGLVPLLLAAALGVLLVPLGLPSTATGIAAVGLAVLGMVLLAPWATYRMARRTQRRTTSATSLLAAGRLVADPRAAGRAAAAVGGIGLVSGGSAALTADVLNMYSGGGDSFYLVSMALVALVLLLALGVVAWTLAVHTVESLLDRKRSTAALVAAGLSLRDLETSQRSECLIASLPLAVAGTLVGTLALGPFLERSGAGALLMVANLALTPALTWLAVAVAVRAVRPWTRRAARAENLRTE